MVLPLIPIAIAGGLGGILGGLFGGEGKKEVHARQEHFAPQTEIIEAAPLQHYSPQMQYAPQTAYTYTGATYQIESPGAVSKKETTIRQESRPEQEGAWTYPIEMGQTSERKEEEGTDFTTIALIAAAGLITYGVVSHLGGSKKKK